jgi:hypothetical protein
VPFPLAWVSLKITGPFIVTDGGMESVADLSTSSKQKVHYIVVSSLTNWRNYETLHFNHRRGFGHFVCGLRERPKR